MECAAAHIGEILLICQEMVFTGGFRRCIHDVSVLVVIPQVVVLESTRFNPLQIFRELHGLQAVRRCAVVLTDGDFCQWNGKRLLADYGNVLFRFSGGLVRNHQMVVAHANVLSGLAPTQYGFSVFTEYKVTVFPAGSHQLIVFQLMSVALCRYLFIWCLAGSLFIGRCPNLCNRGVSVKCTRWEHFHAVR